MNVITESDFKTVINQGLVFVDFYADWCGPCKMAAPILEQMSQKYIGRINIVKLDVDNANATAREYGVQSIPTMIVFKNGVEVDRQIGFTGPVPIEEMIKRHI